MLVFLCALLSICVPVQVMDLAEGHVCALQYIQNAEPARNTYSVFNLGSGQGYSVLDMVRGMQAASGREIKYAFAPRRAGDIAVCYADPSKATQALGWTAKRTLDDSCRGKSSAQSGPSTVLALTI